MCLQWMNLEPCLKFFQGRSQPFEFVEAVSNNHFGHRSTPSATTASTARANVGSSDSTAMIMMMIDGCIVCKGFVKTVMQSTSSTRSSFSLVDVPDGVVYVSRGVQHERVPNHHPTDDARFGDHTAPSW